ncbi:hypothetical protein [Bacillus cereus]|uniref:Uncharacterized protein n=1 Tax=Bacillus cereus TaxID=1396 RepID=A0A164K8K1_BACCE|nr:hypothetical protein [Bacillus cereus]KZD48686.1 hypothetical protein B4088_6614 [Bacillus cereus]
MKTNETITQQIEANFTVVSFDMCGDKEHIETFFFRKEEFNEDAARQLFDDYSEYAANATNPGWFVDYLKSEGIDYHVIK